VSSVVALLEQFSFSLFLKVVLRQGYVLLYFRSRGVRMTDFVHYFNEDTGLNDVLVYELICSMMML